ncbi:MAG TPA: hypothetical protein VFA68_03215 [Terriglobales bacterium]|nr:hypothetical protein [Terriglobales bacterium]
MTNFVKTAFLGTALAAMMLPAVAQTSPAPEPPQQNHSTIDSRQDYQQDRIGRGIENGSLTPGEAARIERNQARLAREEQRMRAANGGKLTAADRAKLDQQQAHLSKQIYNQKHDAQKVENQDPKNRVDARQENQQDRIGRGVANGSLTSAEAARLEKNQARIDKEVAKDRAANGGSLTPQERHQIKGQENRASRAIYKAKHNNRRQ